MPAAPRNRLANALVGTILFLFSALVFGRFVLQTFLARNWVATPAVIRQAGFRHVFRGGCELQATYSYEAAGAVRTSTRVGFGHRPVHPFGGCQPWADRHPQGSTVTAYVSPSNPAQAVLDRGYSLYDIAVTLGLLLASLLNAARLPAALRTRRNAESH